MNHTPKRLTRRTEGQFVAPRPILTHHREVMGPVRFVPNVEGVLARVRAQVCDHSSTHDEMMPLMTSELAEAFWLSNAFALSALCYLFLPSTGVDQKTVYKAFFMVQLPWIPLLAYMFSTGLMGVAGIAQFGSFSVTVTVLAAYTFFNL